MRTSTLFRTLLLAALVGSAFTISGCDLYQASGYPYVENAIPDITLIRAEGWRRDLEAPPYIFGHTGDARLFYDSFSNNPAVASTYVRDDFIYVDAGIPGRTTIRLEAEDADGEYAFVTFEVIVLPSAPAR